MRRTERCRSVHRGGSVRRTSASASPVGVAPPSSPKAASSNDTVSRVNRTLASSSLPAVDGPGVAGGRGLTGGGGGGSPLARAAAAAAAAAATAASKRATSSGGASGGGWLSRGSAAHLVGVGVGVRGRGRGRAIHRHRRGRLGRRRRGVRPRLRLPAAQVLAVTVLGLHAAAEARRAAVGVAAVRSEWQAVSMEQ